MNICYWNVCNATPPSELVEACVELKRVREIGVFCLQEVPYLSGTDALPASYTLGDALGMMSAFEHTRTLSTAKGRVKGYGTAILASALHSVRVHTLRDDRFAYMTPGFNNRRVLMTARTYEQPELTIGVAHLSYRLPLGIGQRALQAERTKLAEHLAGYQRRSAVTFGGDMNCEPGDGLDDLLLGAGLYNLEAGSPTFRSRHAFAGKIQRDLDRVFVSKGLLATAELGDFGPSDHRPVIAHFE